MHNNNNNLGDIKTYFQKNYANKILSSKEGQFITGGEKGDLRFYERIGIKTKNLISLYGDPIRYIEISYDDQYLCIPARRINETYCKYLVELSKKKLCALCVDIFT